AQAAGVPFLLDACQTVGQLEIDVREIGCDLLSGTGRKFLRGPRGTGFLYINPKLAPRLRPPSVDLYAARWSAPENFSFFEGARRFEQFEFNHAARVGLGVAVDHALSWGLPRIEARVRSLAEDLRHALAGIAGVVVRDPGVQRGGIVTFTVDGYDPASVFGAASAMRVHLGISPDWGTLLDMRARGLRAVVRASVHYYNTHLELEALLEVVHSLLRRGHVRAN
ncbi:MAG TPA: aminotransferase class V-fold PLP-dependent enzyme, partial [Nannocystis exedens]|nr:aminotransferase class V-fold PLP-dependent enzyme [Nannocystis exedens]